MGEIISFYSYKGGVGRTMALANLAVLLAQRDKRVLAVDFDLEAPGLHRYLLRGEPSLGEARRVPAGLQSGVIELFHELRKRVQEEAAPSEPGGAPCDPAPAVPAIVRRLLHAGNYGYHIRVLDPATSAHRPLRLLPAGRFDDDYAQRLRDLSWAELYETDRVVFEELAAQWKKENDYVLLDSRTGLSDLGSVSSVILADKLVLALSPNEQSLHGALEVGRAAVLLKRGLGSDLPIFPLLSRVDEGEEQERRRFARDAAARFRALFQELYQSREVDFEAYFDAVQIPHRGFYAYGEKIAAEQERPNKLGSLTEGYLRFLDILRRDRLRLDPAGPARTSDGAVALAVSLETPFEPPDADRFSDVVHAPATLDETMSARLRATPVEAAAWEVALADIDGGVARAVATGAEIHVFSMMPYPAAVYLGRRLDDRARARPVHVYQLDPESRTWLPFSSPSSRAPGAPPPEPFFVLDAQAGAGGDAVLLAIEGMRPIVDEPLREVAQRVGAASVLRLRPRRPAPLRSEPDVHAALADLRAALMRAEIQGPAATRVIHVVATAPLALLIELGRMLVPTVYRGVVVHQFDPSTGLYRPVLDVIARRVIG